MGASNDILLLVLAGIGTALACGLGAIPVFLFRDRIATWEPTLRGLAAGLMTVAAVEGLILPALRGGKILDTGLGIAIGAIFVLLVQRLLGRTARDRAGRGRSGFRRTVLVFVVLFVHSLPEGMAMGAAQASGVEGLNLFVIVAVAVQNVPEGTVQAIPMTSAGYGRWAQFWAAVATSAPQPIGAPLAYLLVEKVQPLLPISLGFAGGAMLAVVALESMPAALGRRGWKRSWIGALAGGGAMVALSIALGV